MRTRFLQNKKGDRILRLKWKKKIWIILSRYKYCLVTASVRRVSLLYLNKHFNNHRNVEYPVFFFPIGYLNNRISKDTWIHHSCCCLNSCVYECGDTRSTYCNCATVIVHTRNFSIYCNHGCTCKETFTCKPRPALPKLPNIEQLLVTLCYFHGLSKM